MFTAIRETTGRQIRSQRRNRAGNGCQPLAALSRAHAALVGHLQPLGEFSRWQGRAIGFAASVAFGLLVLAALIVWIMVRRGHL